MLRLPTRQHRLVSRRANRDHLVLFGRTLVEATALAVALRLLHLPFPIPLVTTALVLGVVPVLGRVLWITMIVTAAVLMHGTQPAVVVLVLAVLGPPLARRIRPAVPSWRHQGRLDPGLVALGGFALAGVLGLVTAVGALGLAGAFAPTPRRTRVSRTILVGLTVTALLVPVITAATTRPGGPAVPPAAGVVTGSGTPSAQVLYVHGLGEPRGRAEDFRAVFAPLQRAFGTPVVQDASYYQDLADRTPGAATARRCAGPSLQPPPIAELRGMPVERATINAGICDSEGDLGLNVLALTEQVRALHARTGRRIVLVGFSMGGTISRGVLTLAALRHDPSVLDALDALVLIHPVSQGARVAGAGQRVAAVPVLGAVFARAAQGTLVDPARPALRQLQPRAPFFNWLASHAAAVPDLPTFVSYGDLRVRTRGCLYALGLCTTITTTPLGDLAVFPGDGAPAARPVAGGARYLPGGPGPQRWEWAERHDIDWDPDGDPLAIALVDELLHAHEQHYNILESTSDVAVQDCQTGQLTRLSDVLLRVIAGRLTGRPYLCMPP